MPSIYHIWYYITVLGQHRCECHFFRDSAPSLPQCLLILHAQCLVFTEGNVILETRSLFYCNVFLPIESIFNRYAGGGESESYLMSTNMNIPT